MESDLRELDGIKQALKHFKRLPTIEQYDLFARKNNLPTHEQIMKQTGLKWTEIRSKLKSRSKPHLQPDYLIEKLREAADLLDGRLSANAYRKLLKQRPDLPRVSSYILVFGEWNKALQAAGIPLNLHQSAAHKYTQEDCKRALQSYMRATGKTRIIVEEYDAWRESQPNRYDYPTSGTIRRKYGFMVTAAEDAGGSLFDKIDDKLAFNSFLVYLNEVLTFDAYDSWAKKHEHYSTDYMIHHGVDINRIWREAINMHIDRTNRAVGKFKL